MKPRDLKGFLDLTGCKPGRHQDRRRKKPRTEAADPEALRIKDYKRRKRDSNGDHGDFNDFDYE